MGAKSLISHSLLIAWKDLMELFRNRMMLIMLVLMPLLMMTMAGFMFPSSSSISHVSVALVNEDEGYGNYTKASTFLIAALEAMNNVTDMMTLTNASSLEDVRNMIQEGEVEGGLVIASDFTSSLIAGKQGTITIVTDQTNPQMSLLLQIALEKVLEQVGTILAQRKVQELNQTVNGTNSLAIVK
ncbi:ABC transporter permease, partial [Candidatus Bathyarchaeota archaeon]|nr:ABC transporter permease [Candidatus Bathyarchaeota archaeon]